VDIAQFRQAFPEFADVARYPGSLVSFWAAIAEQLVSADRFGDLWTHAVNLHVAHHLAMAIANQEAAEQCAVPGAKNIMGGVTSKAVGSVSVSYSDSLAQASEQNGSHWNLTTYGVQYLNLARMIGQGCVQIA